MHVGSDRHLEKELEHHSVHVGGREHGHHVRLVVQFRKHVLRELNVGAKRPVRDHHTLGETGGSGGVVDHRQLVGGVLVVVEVLRLEAVRMAFPEIFIHVLPRLGDARHLGIQKLECVDSHYREQSRHLIGAKPLPDDIVHKENLCLRMVDQVMNIPGLELVKDRHRHSSVGHRGQETDRPVDLVAGADGHLVAFVQKAFLECDVQFLDASCHVPVA